MGKPILCLDFDGVCHLYTSGWKGADVIPDPPVDGLFDFLDMAKDVFDIHIFSSRSNQPGGIEAMHKWFIDHYNQWYFSSQPELAGTYERIIHIGWLKFPTEKPAAFVTIDDRAITFEGTWPDIESLRTFRPWNKR